MAVLTKGHLSILFILGVALLFPLVLCDDFMRFVEKPSSYEDEFKEVGLNGIARASNSSVRRTLGVVKSFSVDSFGAKGDGRTDDTQAFKKAWTSACSSKRDVVMTVPINKNYLLTAITFSGPCNSHITLQINGNIKASGDRSDYEQDGRRWILFNDIDNLSLQGGGGVIDGNGKIWWQNSCKINKNKPCKHAPTAVTFYGCNNLMVRNLKVQNAQQMHISFEKCSYVKASSLTISAPGNSPNTDGIHITNTKNIVVSSATIGTGDDCISIESGSQMVQATGITCGPGHGISIGSLGDDNSEAQVSNIIVNGATLSRTTNGLRIKTWQGGSGIAKNIKFQNIKLNEVANPIIIDQNYCDQDGPCKNQKSAVQVKGVTYQNIKGTSSSQDAVAFNCSAAYPCQGVIMQNVNIKSGGGKQTKATCKNVQLSKIGMVSPNCSSD